MKIFPYMKFVLETTKTPEEIYNKLFEISRKRDKWYFQSTSKLFLIEVHGLAFILYPLPNLTHNVRDGFAPNIIGRIRGEKNCQVDFVIKACTYHWILFTLVTLTIYISIDISGRYVYYGFIYCLYVAAFLFGFWIPCRMEKKVLESLLMEAVVPSEPFG